MKVGVRSSGSDVISFSVIIPTYNRLRILSKTLDFLERQSAAFPFEVIVVDDCSSVPLPDLRFGQGRRENWKLFCNERNLGRAATRNKGIREAIGEYILMIDDDIWASPALLQSHCDAQNKVGGGVVVGRMPISEEVPKNLWNEFYEKWVEQLHVQMGMHKDKLPYNFFFTGNVSVPRGVLETVGLFDESFQGYSGEDTELGYRLKLINVPFVYEPSAIGKHFNTETLDSILWKRKEMGAASFNLWRRHPELAEELSIAGLLSPGKTYYQVFLSPSILNVGRILCQVLAALKLNATCHRLLTILCKAYSGLGLKAAVHDNQ